MQGPDGLQGSASMIRGPNGAAVTTSHPSPFHHDNPGWQEGDVAPFGQALVGCQAQRCWDDVVASSDFETRQAAVAEFNAGVQRHAAGCCARWMCREQQSAAAVLSLSAALPLACPWCLSEELSTLVATAACGDPQHTGLVMLAPVCL